MHHPQLLVFEGDGRLANLLRPLADRHDWLLREPRQLSGCLRLLRRGGPGVLILQTGRNLERELALLERVSWLHPESATILIGDSEPAWLAGLAWDLGASYVLLPPYRERLPEIVTALMARLRPDRPASAEVKTT